MAGKLTDIQAEDENKTNSLIPRSKDTIAEKAKLVSFWFAIFTPGVVEAVYKNTMYLDYYGANPAAYGLFTVLLYVWACAANIYMGQLIDSIQVLPGVFPVSKFLYFRKSNIIYLSNNTYCSLRSGVAVHPGY